jgi:hypothetical protein
MILNESKYLQKQNHAIVGTWETCLIDAPIWLLWRLFSVELQHP